KVAGPTQIGGADTGLRQIQFHQVGSSTVPGQRRGDRADLLIAGSHQERWGASVALHADNVEARFRVGEFAFAVGTHGAAGVEFRVYQRAQCAGSFHNLVHIQAELRKDAQIGAETGGRNHEVHHEVTFVGEVDAQSFLGIHGGDGDVFQQGDVVVLHESAQAGAQLTACRQLVCCSAAVKAHRVCCPAQAPEDLRLGVLLAQASQADQGVGRGVPGTQ